MRFSPADSEMLSRCIRELELRTRAEVVLVVRKVSGNYRDIDYLFGGALSLGMLCFLLFSPWDFRPLSVPLPVALAFFAGAWICRKCGLRRHLTRRARREHQVRRAAEACFLEKKVQRARDQAGILVYLSTMEGKGEILADRGAESHLDPAKLAHFRRMLEADVRHRRRARHLGTFVRSFGTYLGQALPAPLGGRPAGEAGELDDTPELETSKDDE